MARVDRKRSPGSNWIRPTMSGEMPVKAGGIPFGVRSHEDCQQTGHECNPHGCGSRRVAQGFDVVRHVLVTSDGSIAPVLHNREGAGGYLGSGADDIFHAKGCVGGCRRESRNWHHSVEPNTARQELIGLHAEQTNAPGRGFQLAVSG